ncbi:MAG: thioredoxin domain-containing protein [Patescibacteria group bacterium]|nr:thioredoxin domain-containing protein [Patescibacteria group bacterium]
MQKINKPWYKKWWVILLSILGTFILILITASCFYIADEVKRIKSSGLASQQALLKPQKYTEKMQKAVEGQRNYWIGAAKPKITIVEFVDFSCPLCKNSFVKIREISLKYKKDVKIIFRDYPAYEHSLDLAMAARCAGEQGLFWLMHDKLFQNQGISEEKQFSALANQIGADVNRFNNCFANKKYLSSIKRDFADAEKLEVAGTPTWFINGQKIAGDIPYGLFIQIIEKLLKQFSMPNF